MTGSEILVEALARQGFDTLFYLMGGPMLDAERAWQEAGRRAVDVRHEEAAVMAAHGWARVSGRPGLCMAASGPGTANMVPGVANAWADGVPLLVLGGSSPLVDAGRGAFQEVDQVALMRPVTRAAERVHDPRRIPALVAAAVRAATHGRPGPVYLDLPADVLHQRVEAGAVTWAEPVGPAPRPLADPAAVEAAVALLAAAERPLVLSGSGVLWSGASAALAGLVEAAGVPLFTTPQGRGVVAEDNPLCPVFARSAAFTGTDLVLLVGTRQNWMVNFLMPPRIAAGARLIQLDLDPAEIGRNRHADVALVGDARAILGQLAGAIAGRVEPGRFAAWRTHLAGIDATKRAAQEAAMATGARPIHPLRLCREVRDLLDRDAVLVVDGHETLNFGRQSIPSFVPGHRLNSGTFGHMGVGLPYALGARVAAPRCQVVALVGDGSLGMSVMELDTAVRHRLRLCVVVSNNGGWTSSAQGKPGRDLGVTAYHRIAEALGCHAEFVDRPEAIAPALRRALASDRPALVNVAVDPAAHSRTASFARYEA